MGETARFGVSLDRRLLRKFDALIRRKGYGNRSEAVRDLIRGKLIEEEWKAPGKPTFGAALLVYDHHLMSAAERLRDLQHEHVDVIVSTLHVHVDEHNCLEIVVMRGPGDKLRQVADTLLSLKGVKYGKLVLGTTGRQIP